MKYSSKKYNLRQKSYSKRMDKAFIKQIRKEQSPSTDYLQGRFDGYKEGYAEAVKQLKGVM